MGGSYRCKFSVLALASPLPPRASRPKLDELTFLRAAKMSSSWSRRNRSVRRQSSAPRPLRGAVHEAARRASVRGAWVAPPIESRGGLALIRTIGVAPCYSAARRLTSRVASAVNLRSVSFSSSSVC